MAVVSKGPRLVWYLARTAGLAPHHSSGPIATFQPLKLRLPEISIPTGATPL